MWLSMILACGVPYGTAAENSSSALERGVVTDGYVQSCSPEPGCPADDPIFDPTWCTERAEPFGPTVVDGDLVAVDVDPAIGAAIGLAVGTWWSAWRATDGSCESLVVSLVVSP